MIRAFVFMDRAFKFELEYSNFSNFYQTDSLVEYYPEYGIVSVDERATQEYALWASIHECIYQGKHKDLCPPVENPEDRRGMIDIMLLNAMPQWYREEYRKKRIEMYATLAYNNLNPTQKNSFLRAIELLENYKQ